MKIYNTPTINKLCDWFLQPKSYTGTCSSVNAKLQELSDNKLSLLDILFEPDDTGCNLIYYACLHNQRAFIKDLFLQYPVDLTNIEPIQWQSILWEEPNEVHQAIEKFYGTAYYQEIIKTKPLSPLRYCLSNFKECIIGKDLNFFKDAKNLFCLDPDNDYKQLVIALFAFHDLEGTKQNIISKDFELSKDMFNYEKDIFLLDKNELNCLLEVWGKEKTGEIYGCFLEAKNYFHDHSGVKIRGLYKTENLIDFLQLNLDLKDKNQQLLPYLKFDQDILLYSILTKKVSPQLLIEQIENPKLKSEVHYHFLNEALKDKPIGKISKNKI